MSAKPRAKAAAIERQRFDAELLEYFRRWHNAGGGSRAARVALQYCALNNMVMPDWLATLVNKAILRSEKGTPDDLLGFGNKKLLAQWHKEFLQERNAAIRDIPASVAWHKERGTGVTKAQIISAVAKAHSLSVKAIEKILYSPTFRLKK